MTKYRIIHVITQTKQFKTTPQLELQEFIFQNKNYQVQKLKYWKWKTIYTAIKLEDALSYYDDIVNKPIKTKTITPIHPK